MQSEGIEYDIDTRLLQGEPGKFGFFGQGTEYAGGLTQMKFNIPYQWDRIIFGRERL